jgi:hypothetical protein
MVYGVHSEINAVVFEMTRVSFIALTFICLASYLVVAPVLADVPSVLEATMLEEYVTFHFVLIHPARIFSPM